MTGDRRIAFVVPDDIDNPRQPSGGNTYDRQLIHGLRDEGWTVDVRPVARPWPDGVAHAIADLTEGSVVLVDGLLAAPASEVWSAQAVRLRLVVLMHMSMAVAPPGHDRPGAADAERSVLDVAAWVVVTSGWLRKELVTRQCVDPERVSVAPPGAEPQPIVRASPSGNQILCVAPIAAHKGHDVLVAALARLPDVVWACVCVGSLDRDPAFATAVRATAAGQGIGDRIVFAGARSRAELTDYYAASDLLVLPTRSESYGMVLTEALARGLPVVASDVGGVVEAATGATLIGARPAVPGALVPPDDPDALADQLRRWLTDPGTRAEWRRRARQRRLRLHGWGVTAGCVARAIERASALRVP